MTKTPDVLCIGAMLWDVIGRAPRRIRVGAEQQVFDCPGGRRDPHGAEPEHVVLGGGDARGIGRDVRLRERPGQQAPAGGAPVEVRHGRV